MTLGAGGHAAALLDAGVGRRRRRRSRSGGARASRRERARAGSGIACGSCERGSPRWMRTSSAAPSAACSSTSGSRRCSSTRRSGASRSASDGPLDMRMAGASGRRAERPRTSSTTCPEGELADVIYHYGDERRSRRIAAAIVRQPTDRDHRRARRRHRERRGTASGGPPPRAPHVPGAPHRGQPGARGARRVPASRGGAPRSRWPRRRDLLPLAGRRHRRSARSATTRGFGCSRRSPSVPTDAERRREPSRPQRQAAGRRADRGGRVSTAAPQAVRRRPRRRLRVCAPRARPRRAPHATPLPILIGGRAAVPPSRSGSSSPLSPPC